MDPDMDLDMDLATLVMEVPGTVWAMPAMALIFCRMQAMALISFRAEAMALLDLVMVQA